jgi:hypothetical protein
LPNNEDPSGGGLFDPLLKLVGLKKNEQISEFGLAPESNHLQVNNFQIYLFTHQLFQNIT